MHTIDQLLKSSRDKFGGEVALQIKRGEDYEKTTYDSLYEYAKNLSSFLTSKGIKKGERIAIFSENRPEWGIAYFAILLTGAVVVGIDIKLRKELIKDILTHSESRLLFSSSSCVEHLPDFDKVIIFDNDVFKRILDAEYEHTEVEVTPDDIAMLVYTSGTTGDSKAIMLTHNNIVSNVLAAYKFLPAKREDNFLSVLPLSHMFELVGGFLGPLYCGATVTYITSLTTSVIQKTMKETKTTIMQGIPLLFKLIYKGILRKVEESTQPIPLIFSLNMKLAKALRRLHIGKLLLRSVRREFGGHIKYFVSGGAALEPEAALGLECMGMPVLQGYGLTETSPIVSVNTLKANRIGSVGKPLPGVRLNILQDGEIVVEGPNVMKGYYKNPEFTSSVLKDRKFHTGDIGFLDGDGFLYITGRKKNVIVTQTGENVYPEEIEVVIERSPYIKEICVVGERQNGNEKPYAFIIPDYDYFRQCSIEIDSSTVMQILKKEINKYSEPLAEYKRLSDFSVFRGEFPKTTTKKVKRNELKKMIQEKVYKTGTEEIHDELTKKLLSLVSKVIEISEENINLNSDLSMDLGMDSLLRVEILTAIDKKLGIYIPDELSYKIQTFKDIVDTTREYEKKEIPVDSLSDEEEYAFLKERSSLRNFIKSSLSLLFKVYAKWYFDLEVNGLENITGLKSFIITPNHNSLLDVPLVISTLSYKKAKYIFSPAAKDYFFDRNPVSGWFFKLAFDTFPFDRHVNFMSGLKKCKRTIEEGKSLILFPEGTRSLSGEILPFKVGLGAIAFELDVPIIPTYIRGIHEAFGKGMVFPRPNKIKVYFGKPIPIKPYKMRKTKNTINYEIYQEIIKDVREEINKLIYKE